MSPKKSSTDQNKKKRKKLLKEILLQCSPCAIRFPSSTPLIHHIFNEHNFQPNVSLEQVESPVEVLANYITSNKKKRTPAKPKEKKTPGRKRKAPSAKDTTNKPKRQRKDKKSTQILKAALVDTDGYSIPKIKIGRFSTTNAFSIDGSHEEQPVKEHKELPLINRLEPIQNSSTTTSTVTTSTTSAPAPNSNGNASNTDDGLSSFMSEVYHVLDGPDAASLSIPANGDTCNSDFLEMREIQGLYDDDMTYSHFASAFEIPQSKAITSSSQSTLYSSSNMLSDMASSSKISDSLSHNLDSILNKPPSSCMLADKPSTDSSYNMFSMMNNSLPNHNMTSSAFTSTNQKPSLTNHNSNNSSAFMLTSGGSSKVTSSGYDSPNNKAVAPGYASPNKTTPSGYDSPNHKTVAPSYGSPNKSIPSGYSSPNPSSMMSYTPSSPMGSSAGAPSPHKPMSPLVNNVSPCSTPGSPHSTEVAKKKSGLNVIPTEKLMDTSSKQNQLINANPPVSPYYPLNSMMAATSSMMAGSSSMMGGSSSMMSGSSSMMAGSSSMMAGSSGMMPSTMSSSVPYGSSSYYNSMYPYMNNSTSQFMSSPSHMSSYYNFYPPSSQPIEDSQYKRVDPPAPPTLPGPPPFKRPEDPQFKRPGEPPNKQPKIVPKKLSSLLTTTGDKKPGLIPRPGGIGGPLGPPYSIQRPGSQVSISRPPALQPISRPPNPALQLRGSSPMRPPPAPSLRSGAPPPLRGPSLPSGVLPSKPASAPPVENPAANALKKRGITISSVTKPATRKLTSSVNITPVVKKPASAIERVSSQVEIVPKLSTPSRPAELVKDAECNLGIPVIDLSNQSVLANLSSMGITSFIPVNQLRSSNQILGLPIISTTQINRRMDDLGAAGVLNLGSVYKLK